MIRQQRNRLLAVGLFILMALGVYVAGVQSGILTPLISGLMAPLAPITGALNGGVEAIANAGSNTELSPEALKKRNLELERTVAEMQVEIVRLREIEQDYKRLSGIVNYASDNPDKTLVTADVVALDTSSYLR